MPNKFNFSKISSKIYFLYNFFWLHMENIKNMLEFFPIFIYLNSDVNDYCNENLDKIINFILFK